MSTSTKPVVTLEAVKAMFSAYMGAILGDYNPKVTYIVGGESDTLSVTLTWVDNGPQRAHRLFHGGDAARDPLYLHYEFRDFIDRIVQDLHHKRQRRELGINLSEEPEIWSR